MLVNVSSFKIPLEQSPTPTPADVELIYHLFAFCPVESNLVTVQEPLLVTAFSAKVPLSPVLSDTPKSSVQKGTWLTVVRVVLAALLFCWLFFTLI